MAQQKSSPPKTTGLKVKGRTTHIRIKAHKDEIINHIYLSGSEQVTEKTHAEEFLQTTESDYRAIFEGAPVGIFRSTTEGRFVKVNQTMALMYGYSTSAEMIASVQSIAAQLYSEPKLRKALAVLLAEKGEVHNFESLDQRKDGSTFWTSMNVRAIKNIEGKITHYEGFVSDISVRKNYEATLHKMNGQLHDQLDEIKKLQANLRDQAIHDQLTGLYNRRYMHEALIQECARALRENYPISIIVLDLDHLKEINKKYGHFTGGDVALQALSDTLKSMTRAEDIACRYGGDEFIVILHNATAQIAYERTEHWRKSLSNVSINSKGKFFKITFSAGVAAFPANGQNVDEVMQAADKALYQAKDVGRNCTKIFSE